MALLLCLALALSATLLPGREDSPPIRTPVEPPPPIATPFRGLVVDRDCGMPVPFTSVEVRAASDPLTGARWRSSRATLHAGEPAWARPTPNDYISYPRARYLCAKDGTLAGGVPVPDGGVEPIEPLGDGSRAASRRPASRFASRG